MEEPKFSNDMQMLAEIIGEEQTMKVIVGLSGISIYVPKPDYRVIRHYHALFDGNIKKTAQELGVSERMVYRAIQANKQTDRQLTIYDAIDKQKEEQDA